jgi:putative DNA primase/helicase
MVSSHLPDAALRYAAAGYRVFPCRPGAKVPATAHGCRDATDGPGRIAAWWRLQPAANVAIATDGLVVVDIDPAGLCWPGDEDQRAKIKAAHPPLQRTPRGGYHLFFALPQGRAWRCSAGLLAQGVDVRAAGGYVIVAPSIVKGATYQWLRPLPPRDELPPPPDWLIGELDAIEHRRSAPAADSAPAGDQCGVLLAGTRNAGLASLAGRLRRAGLAEGEIAAALLAANRERCSPPLPEREVLSIAGSIARYTPGGSEMCWAMRQAWQHAIEHRKKTHGRSRHHV